MNMRRITIRDNDIIFVGFGPENRPATKEESMQRLKLFYAQAVSVIEGQKNG